MWSQIKIKGKRGISVMIGYVLLVTFAIIISVVVYSWMQSYVPSEDVDCEDGVSLMIYDYSCDDEVLNISFRNSGRFSLAGFTIYGKNSSDVEIATIDLSKNLTGVEDSDYMSGNGRVYFGEGVNSLSPGDPFPYGTDSFMVFNISSYSSLPEIEITPLRSVERNNKPVMAVCGNARIEETINC